MASTERIRNLSAVLTAECNLRCGYCYQNAKNPRRMNFQTLRRALDLALRSLRREVEFVFLGGEPLLEFPMIRRAVDYVQWRNRDRPRVTFGISTNGTLVTKEIASFLAENRFDTQLSFDGLREAQDIRGYGTFEKLDTMLDHLRTAHPEFYRANLRITLTVTPANLGYLAGSVEYFLGKGIGRISISPSICVDDSWSIGRIGEIEAQFEGVLTCSIRHRRRTGNVPLMVFENKFEDTSCRGGGGPMCGVVHGESLTVDVDGEVYGCAVFAGSYQCFGSRFLEESLDPLRMGGIADPAFPDRLESFPAATAEAALFHNKEAKYSSYGRCGECPYIALCTVCPVSIGHVPGNVDPDRVSDFCCAYYRTALRFRGMFPGRKNPAVLLDGPDGVRDDMQRWRALAGTADKDRATARGITPS